MDIGTITNNSYGGVIENGGEPGEHDDKHLKTYRIWSPKYLIPPFGDTKWLNPPEYGPYKMTPVLMSWGKGLYVLVTWCNHKVWYNDAVGLQDGFWGTSGRYESTAWWTV